MPLDEEMPCYLLTCSEDSPLYKNIVQCGEFVVNFPSVDLVDILHFWSLNFRGQLVKPDELGLAVEVSEKVKPFWIQKCYAHLECRLVQEMHHQGYVMLLGKVLAGYLDQNFAGDSGESGDSNGIINNKTVGYVFPFGYSLVDHVDFIIENP